MAFGFLFKPINKPRNSLGIDIGTSSIKVVELEKRSGRFALVNYGIIELKSTGFKTAEEQQPDSLQNILSLPDKEIAESIKELLKKADIQTTDVVASIPSFSTFATVIEMPYISNDDLARALSFEAKKYIPIPLDEVILDWSIVGIVDNGQTKSGKPSTVEVFLAAVPKDETAHYRDIMKATGLGIQSLELENSALIRALLGNDLSTSVIVNIGGRSTSINIIKRGYERVSHNYEIGGFEITRAVSKSLNISLEKAEELKRKFGIKKSGDNNINESMFSLVDMMVFETKKTITSYEESKKEKVSNVVLVGGLTNMPGFNEYFGEKLGRDVTIGNPFSRIMYPEELNPIIPELSSMLSIAVGLAMREI